MDKFWVNKLIELKNRMRRHLAEKAVFEAKPERASLADLREGQRLQKAEEQICAHFAQLAEFATGVPADKFDFRLDFKGIYRRDLEGKLIFGPTALTEFSPYINFEVDKLFGKQKQPDRQQPEKKEKREPVHEKALKISRKLVARYERPIFNVIEKRRFTTIKTPKFQSKIDKFMEKVAGADKYVNSILDKYKPEQKAVSEAGQFFIYQGEFVYLSRKGKWAAVRTTVLTQKDYFEKTGYAMPEFKRRLRVIEPYREMEIAEASELITDDLAEPVASSAGDLGLGYFVPVRRLGKSKAPVAEREAVHRTAPKPAAMPLLGSREFVADVMQKTESSGLPIEEISPAYVSVTGRKIERARSFAEIIKGKLQLPKSEPARLAMEALLPRMEAILVQPESEKAPEDRVLSLERSFDNLISAHIQPFKIALRATAPSRIAPALSGEGRLERIFESPTQDSLGIINRYTPEVLHLAVPSAVMLSRLMRTMPSVIEGITSAPQRREVSPEMAAITQPAGPVLPAQTAVPRTSEEVSRRLPGILERITSRLPMPQMERFVSGLISRVPARFGLERASAFAGSLMGRFTSGIPGRVAENLGAIFSSERGGGLMGRLASAGSRIGGLLRRGGASSLIGSIVSGQAPSQSPQGALSRFRPGELLSGITEGGRASDLMRGITDRLGSANIPGISSGLDAVAGVPGERAAGLQRILSQGLGGLLQRGTQRLPSLLERLRGGSGTASQAETSAGAVAQASGGLLSSLASRGRSLLSNLPGGLGEHAQGLVSRISSAVPRVGSIAQRASSMASGPLGRIGGTSGGGIMERAGGLLGRLAGGSGGGTGIGSLLSRAAPATQGIMGQVSEGASGLLHRGQEILSGGSGQAVSRIAGALPGGAGRAVSGLASRAGGMGGIGGLASRAEGLSGAISGLAGRAGGMLGRAASPLMGRAGASGAALPSLGGMRAAAGEAAERMGASMPGADSIPDMSSILSGAALPVRTPERPQLPRGWDRPPFEVGEAISRQISGRTDELPSGTAASAGGRLADYGLSVIDLEESPAGEAREAVERVRDESEVDIDEDTMQSIYFRLRRILETEGERMGGEA